MPTNTDRWKAYRRMAEDSHKDLMRYINTIIADEVADSSAPLPPTVLNLPWNLKSPWPFPTQGKQAPPTRVKYITLHHSAGQRATTNITHWNRLHTQVKRWPHIGYHFAIAALERGAPVDLYQCNRIGEFTWHDSRNHDTVGVCVAGDLREHFDNSPTADQAQLTGRLLAWLIPQLPNFVGVVVHKAIQATACPGDVERWGDVIIKATAGYGLDIAPFFNVQPGRAMRSRMRGVLRREPMANEYEDV